MKRKSKPESIARICLCLKGIVHPTRMAIIALLRGGELSVGEIVSQLNGVTQSNVSQHLSQMKGCGILVSRREGAQIFYSAADPRLFDFMDLMKELFL